MEGEHKNTYEAIIGVSKKALHGRESKISESDLAKWFEEYQFPPKEIEYILELNRLGVITAEERTFTNWEEKQTREITFNVNVFFGHRL